jgi:hypothetical protein
MSFTMCGSLFLSLSLTLSPSIDVKDEIQIKRHSRYKSSFEFLQETNDPSVIDCCAIKIDFLMAVLTAFSTM